ncbi:MAG TPA: dTDP-4-dehydrorhamnose 3,5-epimerase [Polyangiaceae bacterium]|jgi:dTDP-4-dehydrorhamnose 3,5-epimerase|nr:dTDP-4-dehydrorhamnose 3,5-epimerase [Polyangiaceae bacterium]
MEIIDLELEGLKLIRSRVFRDDRGFFQETYNAVRYAEAGIVETFVQDNHSRSIKGTLRGLHYQSHPGQAKLVQVTVGRIWDVVVDIRPGSKTFGRWSGVELDAEKKEQLFVPIGFAHGFCVLSEAAEVQYKCSAVYNAETECTLNYADPDLAVRWPTEHPILSARDQHGEPFASFRARVER